MEERTHKKKDCTVHAVQLGGCQLGAVQLGGVLADKGHLGVTLLRLVLVLQLEIEGEEAGGKVDLDDEDDHSAPRDDTNEGAPVHHVYHVLLLLVVVPDSDISIIVPSGEGHDDGEDAEDGVEEVEDCKDEDAAGPLTASSANAQQG